MSELDKTKQLFEALTGGPLAIFEMADAAVGGHVKQFFQSSQQDWDADHGEEVRDAALEAMQLAGYNGTRIHAIIDVLRELIEVTDRMNEQWKGRAEQQPEIRDVVNAVAVIADGYVRAPPVRRNLLMTALRGSFAPDLFLWGQQHELLEKLVAGGFISEDIGVLEKIPVFSARLEVDHWGGLYPTESVERLARANFIEIQQSPPPGQQARQQVHHRFIRQRHEATTDHFTLNITRDGQRLLAMLEAGEATASVG